jgi:hypothetical protein
LKLGSELPLGKLIQNDMRKPGYVNLTVALVLLLLAVILFLSSGRGSGGLNSEKVFIAALHNSLYYLDQAKWQWLEEKQKSEQDVPTMEELAPYLGDWTNHIKRFVALGISYKITSMEEHQSDVATLTRDLRFRSGICRFYRAGTSYCIRTHWSHPPSSATTSFRALYFQNQYLLAAGLFVFAMGNLLAFVVKRIGIWKRRAPITDEPGP